jgi:hypothetical protein
MMDEIIAALKSGDNEATAAPWWLIIDPKQNFRTDDDGIYYIVDMITGPFFSRADAQQWLDNNPHHYSKNAKVFCHSGCYSKKYYDLCKANGI